MLEGTAVHRALDIVLHGAGNLLPGEDGLAGTVEVHGNHGLGQASSDRLAHHPVAGAVTLDGADTVAIGGARLSRSVAQGHGGGLGGIELLESTAIIGALDLILICPGNGIPCEDGLAVLKQVCAESRRNGDVGTGQGNPTGR